MATVRKILNEIWSIFRSVGIADDLMIIDRVSRLLTEDPDIEDVIRSSHDLADEASRFFRDEVLIDTVKQLGFRTIVILKLLRLGVEQAGSPGEFFDRYILFRLPAMQSGGRYPTPRHIVQFILRLAAIEPFHSLADFACGTGGFLVHRPCSYDGHAGLTVGAEIALDWAELARINSRLHSMRIEILSQNAFMAVSYGSNLENNKFDRIVMNPPFGEKVDTELLRMASYGRVGSRSETAFITLTLRNLAREGRAAILVPSGVFFSKSRFEVRLREQLLDEVSLDAIISLPKDALQPFSHLQTNLVIFSNILPPKNHLTWFFQLERDGYPSGRGRDLTQEPNLAASDLSIVEEVLLHQSQASFLFFQVRIRVFFDNEKLRSITVQSSEEDIQIKLLSLDFYPESLNNSAFFLIEVAIDTLQRFICICVLLNNGEPSLFENRKQQIQQIYNLGKKSPDPGIRLLPNAVSATAITVAVDDSPKIPKARVLGVAVRPDEIRAKSYDFRPERYIGRKEHAQVTSSPTELLARIYNNQQTLSKHIDSLFGRLDLPSSPQEQILPPIVNLEPFGKLNNHQLQLWEKVREKTELVNSNNLDNDLTARHFTPQEVDPNEIEDVSQATLSTLRLLECMGLIVPVSISDSENEPVAFYRRVTAWDLWQLDSEESALEETR